MFLFSVKYLNYGKWPDLIDGQQRRRCATRTIQRVYRGWMVRKQIKKQQCAARIIQTATRKYLARKQTKKRQCAARIIQIAVKKYLAKQLQLKKAEQEAQEQRSAVPKFIRSIGKRARKAFRSLKCW